MEVWCASNTTPGSGMDADKLPKVDYVFYEDVGDDGCGNGTMRQYAFSFATLKEAVCRWEVISYCGMCYYDGIIRREDEIPEFNSVPQAEIEAVKATLTEDDIKREREALEKTRS